MKAESLLDCFKRRKKVFNKVSIKIDTLLKTTYHMDTMDENIKNVLRIIHEEQQKAPIGVKRSILNSFKNKELPFTTDLVIAIQGVRRCGKSTLLRQIAHHHKIEERSIFINFEDPRLGDQLDHTLLESIVEFHRKHSSKSVFFFFDEIQNVKNWERWLHIQLEKPKHHFIITGSNSTLLSGKLGSALTGRHITLELFPFSFDEFLKVQPQGTLEDYLEKGGFPRALTYADPETLLREYFTDIIERDVRRHVAARSSTLLIQTAKAVFETTGSETSYRNLAKAFDTTADTIKIYVDAFQAAYLCLACPYFTYSERKSAVRPRKYYPIDLGLRRAITTKVNLDLGKKLETFVFHSLLQRYRKVSYWRGKGEVDFVVETEHGVLPIQVSWDGPKERHFKALEEFKKEHPKSLTPIFIERENVFENLYQLEKPRA